MEVMENLKEILKKCKRVLKVATKPSRMEFSAAAKITGLGILLIGGIGFAIFIVYNLLIG